MTRPDAVAGGVALLPSRGSFAGALHQCQVAVLHGQRRIRPGSGHRSRCHRDRNIAVGRDDIAGRPHARMRGRAQEVDRQRRSGRVGAREAKGVGERQVDRWRRRDEQGIDRVRLAVGIPRRVQRTVRPVEGDDRGRHDADAASPPAHPQLVVEGLDRAREGGELLAPLPNQLDLVHALRRGRQHAETAARHLEAVAVRAVQHMASPVFGEPRDGRQLVAHSAGDDDGASGVDRAVGAREAQHCAVIADAVDLALFDAHAVAAQLVAPAREQRLGIDAVVPQDAVHVRGEAIARAGAVDHQRAPTRTSQHLRGAQTGRAAADDDRVPLSALHRSTVEDAGDDCKHNCTIGKLRRCPTLSIRSALAFVRPGRHAAGRSRSSRRRRASR